MDYPELQFPVPGTRQQYQQSMALAAVAGRMQLFGWKVDREACARHRDTALERQARFRAVFSKLSGIEDLGKDGGVHSVRSYFWDTLKAPTMLDPKTKKPSLNKTALVEYAQPGNSDELRKAAASLYAFRRNGKLIGYMDAYLELSSRDGRVHPSWNIWGTKTSRWSCADPNIQQLSGRAPTFDFGSGPEPLVDGLKNILVADDGFVLVGADYSALELYLQTYIAGASKLLQWMDQEKDLHMENAKAVLLELKLPPDATKKTHKAAREIAKLFFGFSYLDGDHVDQVWKQMKDKLPALQLPLVKVWRKRYFALHPEFLAMQENNRRELKEDGFITTPLLERRLYLHDSSRGFNQAHNGKAQITAGDLANVAMLRLAPQVDWANRMVLAQVHDSIVGQCRPDDVGTFAAAIGAAMTQPVKIYGRDAKFVAEPDAGPTWEAMKPL